MASSGSFNVNVISSGQVYCTLSWQTTSQDINNNTSTISWALTLVTTSGWSILSSSATGTTVIINGGTVFNGNVSVAIGTNQTRTLASGSTTIPHNSDGTKTFAYSFSKVFNITFIGAGTAGTVSGNNTGILDTIPRASSFIANPTSSQTFGSSTTFTVTPASSSFLHNLSFVTNGFVNVFAQNISTSTTYTWPASWAANIPNNTTFAGQVRCDTYNNGIWVGQSEIPYSLTIPNSSAWAPTFSVNPITDLNTVTSSIGVFVQNISQLQLSITNITGQQGATVSRISLQLDGTSGSTASLNYIPSGSGIRNWTATVADSRGLSTSASGSFTVLAYSQPAISVLTVQRCDINGALDSNGTYVLTTVIGIIAALNNLNTTAWTLSYRPLGGTWVNQTISGSYNLNTSIIISGMNVDSQYEFQANGKDLFFTSYSLTVILPTAFVLIDFGSQGDALAFGKVSETTGIVEVANTMPWTFQTNALNVNNINSADNTTIEILPNVGSDQFICPNDTGWVAFTMSASFPNGAYCGFMVAANIMYVYFYFSNVNALGSGTSQTIAWSWGVYQPSYQLTAPLFNSAGVQARLSTGFGDNSFRLNISSEVAAGTIFAGNITFPLFTTISSSSTSIPNAVTIGTNAIGDGSIIG